MQNLFSDFGFSRFGRILVRFRLKVVFGFGFRYFLNYTDLTNSSDVTRIPEAFDTVIVDGALYHLYMFKDNIEAANAAYQAFTLGIKDLQTLYINNFEYVRDTRVAF